MEGGGGASYAAQEPRELQRQGKEEEKAPRADGGKGGGMKFRVSARAPHGVGALLLIGGAVLAGAAVVAWRHARRGGGGDKSRGRDRQPPKQEALGGGVVEDGKSGAPAQEIDRPDDNPRGEEEKTEIASNGLDNGGVTSEIEEVHDDAEIVADESNSEPVEEKNDLDSGRSSTEISMHEDVDSEHVEKFDQNSSSKLSEATTQDTDNEIVVQKGDKNSTKEDLENDDNSTKNNTDNDDNSTKNDIQNDEDSITTHIDIENENLSENDLKEEMAPNDNEDVEASDQCSLSISRPVIVLDKQPSLHTDCAQVAESMENSPTAQLMMRQEQLLEDMTVDTEAETAEAKPTEGTIVDKDVWKKEEQKEIAEPVGLADSPALPTPVKPSEKKEPEFPAQIENGMKIEYANGGLKEHGRISKGGALPGGAVTTMDRRSPSMAILVLMFVLTVGIAIAVRLFAPPRATKLQIDLQ